MASTKELHISIAKDKQYVEEENWKCDEEKAHYYLTIEEKFPGSTMVCKYCGKVKWIGKGTNRKLTAEYFDSVVEYVEWTVEYRTALTEANKNPNPS